MDNYTSVVKPFIRWLNRIQVLIGVLACLSLLAEYGYYLSPRATYLLQRIDFFIIFFYIAQFLIRLSLTINKAAYLKSHWFEALLSLLIFLELSYIIFSMGISPFENYLIGIDIRSVTKVYIVVAQIIIFLAILNGIIRYNKKIAHMKFHPAQFILFSFLSVILFGSFLLSVPKATTHPISFIDALFTSTSATCVTGLTVLDTGKDFSRLGQFIILFLIQIGGLGIMTLASFLSIFFGKGMGIREKVLIGEMLDVTKTATISRVIRHIILITFFVEFVGAFFLFNAWLDEGWTFFQLLYVSIFHSISAFCNAGFSTFSDSLMGFQDDLAVLLTISALIILGGLGFVSLMDLGGTRLLSDKPTHKIQRLQIQTKLVLIVTVILIFGGWIILTLINYNSMPLSRNLLNSIFTSITARTAGFNSVDMSKLPVPAISIVMCLMFIGGGPGSTAGGIKTSTLGVLGLHLKSIIVGDQNVVIFRKAVPTMVINRAMVVVHLAMIVIILGTFLLLLTESADLLTVLFEVVSAFATVGLSLGLTPFLTFWGKFIIICIMFIGRIGVLTLAFAVFTPQDKGHIKYPSESIMVG